MESLPTIYGSVVSPFVRKVLMVLSIKQLTYTLHSMNPFSPADKQQLLTMTPLGKIPIYQEGGFLIPDSSVICAYLEKKHPTESIYPKKSENYARCLWLEEYADTQLFPAMLTVFYNIVLAPIFKTEPNTEAVQEALQHKIPPLFDYLDREIGEKVYCFEDTLSLSDLSIIAPFINFHLAGQQVDPTRWKNLDRYVKHLSTLEPIKSFNEKVKETLTRRSK